MKRLSLHLDFKSFFGDQGFFTRRPTTLLTKRLSPILPQNVSIAMPVAVYKNCKVIMRPSSLGGAAYCVALCPSVCLSVCLSVRPSRYCFCLFYSRTVLRASIQNRKNFCFRLWASVTFALFGTHRGPHIVRPSRPHKFLFLLYLLTSGHFKMF